MTLLAQPQPILASQPPIMMMTGPPMPPMRPPPLMMAAPSPMGGFVTTMLPQMGPPIGMPMIDPAEQNIDNDPASKKTKNEDSLITEEVFLLRNPSPVSKKGYDSHDSRKNRMETYRTYDVFHVAFYRILVEFEG
ncbi:hypothetical protein WA026_019931 [Henosepilachna vigintioctopunctata]|uniref:Uncharacterized protein n=1 Tax=Henosepilachna vigintioctopunctata TaxID=420089 RepID=A0AAW1UU73_9CUCU